jgi:arabinofuranosyltransferase
MIIKRRIEILSLLALLLIVAGLGFLFTGQHLDQSFVTYRYARNLAAGQGFAYNPGEPALTDLVTPLYVLLLSLAARFSPDLPLTGNLIGAVSIGIGALALYFAVLPTDKWTALLVGGLFAIFPLLWMSLGLEIGLWMALALLSIMAYLHDWPVVAAVFLALATLIRPEIAVLAAVLIVDAIATGRRFEVLSIALYAGIVILGLLLVAGSVETGGVLPGLPGADSPGVISPNVWAGLAAIGGATFALSPLWIVLPALAIPGLVRLPVLRRREDRWALVLTGWAVLHVVTLALFGAAVYPWHFAPLIPALAALIGLGAGWLVGLVKEKGIRAVVIGVYALLLVGAATDSILRLVLTPPAGDLPWQAMQPALIDEQSAQAGFWLLENTTPDTVVATSELGTLGYISERPILDPEGRLQPDLAEAYRRGDTRWWINAYLPDVVVLHESQAADLVDAASNPWLAGLYAEQARFGETDPLVIFTRTASPPPLAEQMLGMVGYPNGLILNTIAIDYSLSPLEGGRTGRMRLEWLLNQPFDEPQYVSIAIRGRNETLAALNGQWVDFQNWPQRRLITTFHTVDLLPDPLPGVYDLSIGIGPDPDALSWQIVAQGKVPFPESVFVGAMSGVRADFGDLTLSGYRLSSTPEEGLQVLLAWEANQPPQADYRIFIQVRSAGLVAAQTAAEPHDGAYPTSVWETGEKVTDTYQLDTSTLEPAQYEVYVGLLDPDGMPLLTTTGQDAVFVGTITITGE